MSARPPRGGNAARRSARSARFNRVRRARCDRANGGYGRRGRRDLVLTTTLQPCLQCAAVIRLGPIAAVRFAGPDRYWDGCHDFGKLSAREARRGQPARTGPRRDELDIFATLISRLVHLPPAYEEALRALGEGPMVDLVHELEGGREVDRLAAMDVIEGFGYLWPRLQELAKVLPA
jgi:hypothetical protein